MECDGPATRSRTCGVPLAVAVLTFVLSACSHGSPLFQGGVGSTESAPFELEIGSYLLAWTTSAQTRAGCQILVELLTAEGDTAVASAEGGSTSGGASQGSEAVSDLAAGSYRLRVESTCEAWTAVVGEGSARGA